MAVKLLKQGLHIAAIGIEQIIAIRRPFAVAMAAQIECHAVVTGVTDNPRRTAPGAAALTAAMEKEDRRSCRIAKGFTDQLQSIPPIADGSAA